MLDKKLLWTGVALCMVSAVAVVTALAPWSKEEAPVAEPLYETVPGITAGSRIDSRPQLQADTYLIRDYNGYVAVFGQDPDQPEIVLNKLVKYLPEYDRIQLREGVRVHGFEELNARIEDYIS